MIYEIWHYVNQLSGCESHTSVARQPINNATIKFDFSSVNNCSTQSCLWTVCQFPGCKQTGLYFIWLDKHLKWCHPGKTREDNLKCPSLTHEDCCLVKKNDQECQACQVISFNLPKHNPSIVNQSQSNWLSLSKLSSANWSHFAFNVKASSLDASLPGLQDG